MREIHLAGKPSQWILGPRTTVSIPSAVENGALVASATLLGGNQRFIRRCDRSFGNFDECENRPSSGSKWEMGRSLKLRSNTRTNQPFVRALALAFSSDGPAGKSRHLICENVAR